MTTNTISTLAKRTEAELSDMITKAECWIASIGTPRERSEADVAMARETIAAIGREHLRRHEETWSAQSTRSPGDRAAAAFAQKPLDRHERRFLAILLEEGDLTHKELATRMGWKGGTSLFGSIVSERAAFFGPPIDDHDGSEVHILHLVRRIEDDGAMRLRLRDDVRDAVVRAVRDHDLEMERKRRIKGR